VSPKLQPLFWDSCVFIRYLTDDSKGDCYADICRFIDEAKAGRRKIYYSTMIYAEIREASIRKTQEYGTIRDFVRDLGSNFYPVDPNPNILMAAGELRSASAVNPDPKGNSRVIGTADAIMLMTALFTRDAMGEPNLQFHSFDKGSGKSWEGKCVPLIGFQDWFPAPNRTPRILEVFGLDRSLPRHPEPMLEGVVIHARFPQSQPGVH
jgi:predicted nucleic acid-binding protein